MSDATALAADIADGRTTARAAMEAALTAAGQPGSLGAVARVNHAGGMNHADAAGEMPCKQRGRLHGVPVPGRTGLFPAGMYRGLPVGLQLLGPMRNDHALLEPVGTAAAKMPSIRYPHPIAGLIS